jgi:hypothetical protein
MSKEEDSMNYKEFIRTVFPYVCLFICISIAITSIVFLMVPTTKPAPITQLDTTISSRITALEKRVEHLEKLVGVPPHGMKESLGHKLDNKPHN